MVTHSPPPPAAFYQQIIAESGIISIFLEILLRSQADEEYSFPPSPSPSPSPSPVPSPSPDPPTSASPNYHDSTQAELLKSLCSFAEHKANLLQLYSGMYMTSFSVLSTSIRSTFILSFPSANPPSSSFCSFNKLNLGSILRVIAYVLTTRTHTAIALELSWKVLEAIPESRTGSYIGPIIHALAVCQFFLFWFYFDFIFIYVPFIFHFRCHFSLIIAFMIKEHYQRGYEMQYCKQTTEGTSRRCTFNIPSFSVHAGGWWVWQVEWMSDTEIHWRWIDIWFVGISSRKWKPLLFQRVFGPLATLLYSTWIRKIQRHFDHFGPVCYCKWRLMSSFLPPSPLPLFHPLPSFPPLLHASQYLVTSHSLQVKKTLSWGS